VVLGNRLERVVRELTHRANQFSNCFIHAEADAVEKPASGVRRHTESANLNAADPTWRNVSENWVIRRIHPTRHVCWRLKFRR
jgi:hypothetical protein